MCSSRGGQLGQVDFLAQGTLYPDVIESVAIVGQSALIKSHHNVGGLARADADEAGRAASRALQDEVREVGRKLGLDEEFVVRQPFPGPGLAVRILGEVTPERLGAAAAPTPWWPTRSGATAGTPSSGRASPCCCPCKAFGVMGDERTYEYTAAIRAGREPRRHDRGLGAAAARLAGTDLVAHRERSARHQSRGLRHQLQAAVDD